MYGIGRTLQLDGVFENHSRNVAL